jgi:hypothetical protein
MQRLINDRKEKHSVPLPENLINDLLELKRMNGEGFVFSRKQA